MNSNSVERSLYTHFWNSSDTIQEELDLWRFFHEVSKLYPYQVTTSLNKGNQLSREIFSPQKDYKNLNSQKLKITPLTIEFDEKRNSKVGFNTVSHLLFQIFSKGSVEIEFDVLDFYLWNNSFENVEKGLHYLDRISMEIIQIPNTDEDLNQISTCVPNLLEGEYFLIVIVAQMQRIQLPNKDQQFRHVLLNVGRVCEFVCNVFKASNFKPNVILSFFDDIVCEILNLDGFDEVPLALIEVKPNKK